MEGGTEQDCLVPLTGCKPLKKKKDKAYDTAKLKRYSSIGLATPRI